MKKQFGLLITLSGLVLSGCSIFAPKPKYEIIFKNDAGNIVEMIEVEEGTIPTSSYDPLDTKEWDYSLVGWSKTKGGEAEDLKPATQNETYYAVIKKEVRKYDISFYTETGSLIETTKVEYNKVPSCSYRGPEDTEKAYYVFKGWSKSLNGEVLKSLPSVKENANYYAIVEEHEPSSNLVLDSSNAYSGSSVNVQNYDGIHTFTYSQAISSAGNHVALKTNGYVKNSTIIKGAVSIVVNFTGSLTLRFGSTMTTYCEAFPITSGTVYKLDSYDTYFNIEATEASTISNITIAYGGEKDTKGARPSKQYETVGMYFEFEDVSVAIGQTKQLNLLTYPSNATLNKTVTWTSNDTNVASVNSNGLVTAVSTVSDVSTYITATNTYNNDLTASIKVKISDKDAWTVMIYMCGADLESDNGLATEDITEILSVANQPDDVNIIIETGGARRWNSTYGISASYLTRWHVENKKLVKDDQLTKASMGKSATLQSFIEYGLTTYPSDKTGLILWNHGGGMSGVCFDENANDDSLINSEVKSAVTGAMAKVGKTDKLEFIGYDACLMQVQDIAEFNSHYFNYMIGSEESESGYGWDYDTWVDDLYAKKPTETILKACVDGFITENGGTSSSKNDQTLSYLNLSYMSAYMTAWEDMAKAIDSKTTSSQKSSFKSLVTTVKHYADDDYSYYGLFDAKDFINKLSNNSTFNPGSTYINNVLNAFNNLVAYASCGRGAGNSNGLCMVYTVSSSVTSDYTSSETNFTNWRSLCSKLGN